MTLHASSFLRICAGRTALSVARDAARRARLYAQGKAFHWVCKSGKLSVTNEGWKETTCHRRNGYRFSVLSGTIFENTNYPLSTWFEVIYLMTQSKKGISALSNPSQISSGDYRTAWYMCMRIRGAMEDKEFPEADGRSRG